MTTVETYEQKRAAWAAAARKAKELKKALEALADVCEEHVRRPDADPEIRAALTRVKEARR